SIQPAVAGFSTGSPMITARTDHTATLLPNGKVLVAGGTDYTNVFASAELYDPVTGAWTATGSMNTARDFHSATLLPNGKVLVAGGYDTNSPSLTTAELYDPATGTWRYTAPPINFHTAHTATLLADGRVLVALGFPSSPEIYNPSNETWSAAGTPKFARQDHTATLLPDGKVLVVGGDIGEQTLVPAAELFDPATLTWTTNGAGALNVPRNNHTATLLPNGEVLIAGGADFTNYLSSAELYNPTNGTWTLLTNLMSSGRGYATATLLPNGTVLVAEGYADFGSAGDIFNPASGAFAQSGTGWPGTERWQHTATLLPNAKVLIAGGILNNAVTNSVDIYEAVGGAWSSTGALSTARYDDTATLLPTGKVLIAGGIDITALNSMELYDPATGNNLLTGTLITARYHHTSTLLPSGKVLLAGGTNSSGLVASAELYDPAAGTSSVAASLSVARYLQTATLMADGRVLVVGGLASTGAVVNADIYDPVAGTWTPTGSLHTSRFQHTATLIPDGRVFVAGGFNTVPLSTSELYDPATGTWALSVPIFTARYQHTATLLPSGKVLVAGGASGIGQAINSAVICDPATGSAFTTLPLSTSRFAHTATLLPNGKVLVAGGFASSALFQTELYDPVTQLWTTVGSLPSACYRQSAVLLPSGKVFLSGGYGSSGPLSSQALFDAGLGFLNAWQPQITSLTSPATLTGSLVISGARFRGISEGSYGTAKDSSADYPVTQLRSVEGERTVFLLSTNWSTNSVTCGPLTNFPPGYAMATVFANGIPSQAALLDVMKASAAVTLSNLVQAYDGTAKSVSATTAPPGLAVIVTYNGSSAAPTNAGSYTVVALVNDLNYQGGATNTLVIEGPPPRNFGVDVSHFQDAGGIPATNWAQMYAQGIRFAFVKASEGLTGPDDPTMAANMAGAQGAGLLAGVYHFAHPENRPTTNGAVQEADHFLNYAGSFIGPGRLRPVLDMEETSSNLPPATMTDWVLAFLQEVASNRGAGATPIIYCTSGYAATQFDSRLAGNALWVSAGGGSPTNGSPSSTGVFTNWAFWQYDVGSAGGISPIDLDVCHDEFEPLTSYLIPMPAPGWHITSAVADVGGFHVSFTNVPGTRFTLIASTNVVTPLSNWTVLGAAAESPPGQFLFTDPQATNLPQRYYRIRWP
ncbi:MAG TPA: kelch repeat-containing protein, partial [Candidatus Acidoferrum sp.]|nr:kelch repeat-containing protein [Candidatus Acidoferrum sp.]